jgi:uncharacterized protein (TIRG00374 family)
MKPGASAKTTESTPQKREPVKDNANRSRRISWGAIVGLIVSGVSLYIAIRNLRPIEVWRAFQQANYTWIIPAVTLYLFALMARTARWKALLSAERRIPWRELLPTMAMGRGANNIYPFRTGEIVRVLLLRRRNEVPAAAGLASILVERVFDGLTMILLLLVAALIGGIPEAQQVEALGQTITVDLRAILWLAMVVFGAALSFVYAMVLWPNQIQRVTGWFVNRLVPQRFRSRAQGIIERFIHGFSSVKSVWTLTMVMFFSLTVWTAETISYRLLMNAFGFGVNLHQLLLMSGAANLGTALPSGPGNVGTFDAPSILVLAQIGIPVNTAISYQTLLHAVLWSTETFAGLWFMWRTGLRKRDLDQSLEEITDD